MEEKNRVDPQVTSATFVIVVVIVIAVISTAVLLVFSSFVTTKPIPSLATLHITGQQVAAAGTSGRQAKPLQFNPPSPNDAPADIRPAVLHGEAILRHTHQTLPEHTGNKLDCTNCHFEGGTTEKALSLVGVSAVYPKYMDMMKRPVDLAMMTNACFMRYLNAPPLQPDGNDMVDILAYYHWISKDIPIGADVPWLGLKPVTLSQKPDVAKGKNVFTQCTPCHGDNGQGLPSDGPPLWGDGAFPAGGGMGQEDMLAAFVHKLMPKDNPDLSQAQAADVAAFVLSHQRPKQKEFPQNQ